MEILPLNFYKTEYLSNTMYLVQMVVESYLAKNVFRNDPSRVIFADTSNVFRERMRRLKEKGYSDVESLNLPFASYWNPGNWIPDDRPGMLNAKAALTGFSEATIGYQKLKFLNTKVSFECMAFFSSYKDAQLAYETLLWIDKPGPQQFSASGVEYKGYTIDIPINFSVENLVFQPDTVQKDFFSKKKIIPIRFEIVIRSVSFAQKAQPEGSSIFGTDEIPYLTKKVMLDFLNYKFDNQYWDKSNIVLEVQRALDPSWPVTPLLQIQEITETSITISWFIDPDVTNRVKDTVLLNLNSFTDVEVSKKLGSYTFTGLSPESLYNITMWVTTTEGKVDKATVTATTTSSAPIFLKGIKGY